MFKSRSLLTNPSLGVLSVLCAAACSSGSSKSTPTTNPDSGVSQTNTDVTGTEVPASSAPGTAESDGSAPSSDVVDAGETLTSEAPSPDAGSDTPEPDVDSGVSTEPAAGDAGSTSADGGASDPWAGCPQLTEPQSQDWPVRVHATETAVYCAMFNENRTLVEEKAAKLQLRIAPGVHRVPDVDSAALALPACIRDGSDAAGVVTGSMTVSKTPGEGNTSYSLGFTQEFGERDPRRLQLSLQQTFDDAAPVEFLLDGAEVESLDAYQSMDLCDVEGEYCFPSIIFTSCAYASGELNTHTVEFAGGEISLDLRIGESFAGTEPGAFVEAHGSYLGETFAQDDYFKLIYHPAHHHFERAFVVLFDEPRGEVCGIEVSGLEPFGDDVPDTAFTVNCALDHLDELTVSSHTLVRESR